MRRHEAGFEHWSHRANPFLKPPRRSWPPPAPDVEPARPTVTPPGLHPRHVWHHWQHGRATVSELVPFLMLVAGLLVVATRARSDEACVPSPDCVEAGTLFFRDEGNQLSQALRMHTAVKMEISGIVNRVTVTQRFQNDSDEWVEGLYVFPLPEDAAVDRMRMEVGGRITVGEIREKAVARAVYEQARKEGRRASLVEQNRPNLFRNAVANIGPHEAIDITIGYLQIVDQSNGRYSLRFPLTITPRYTPFGGITDPGLQPELSKDAPRQSVDFDISLDAGVPLRSLSSAYHAVTTQDAGEHHIIRLADPDVAADRDFELNWTPDTGTEPAAALFTESFEGEQHVLLMLMPPQEDRALTTPRELVFVIDTSGSMGGASLEQAKAALLQGLGTLTGRDRFNIIQFNSVFETLHLQPVAVTPESIREARRYVNALRATGGTEMQPALAAALAMTKHAGMLRQIVFITDGAVSNEEQLFQLIASRLGNARLFTVGIGSAPNGHFMRKAAQWGRGTFTFIGAADQVDARMGELLRKLERPVLTDIQIQWPGGVSPDYAPARIGDLYAGEPLIVTARLAASASGVLTVSGNDAGGAWVHQSPMNRGERHTGVASLWARKRIGDILDTRATGTAEEELRSKVLPLALRYRLVSAYTSLVAVELEPVRPVTAAMRTQRVSNVTPHGAQWDTAAFPQTSTSAPLQILLGLIALLLAAGMEAIRRTRAR